MKIYSWKDVFCIAGIIGGAQFVVMTSIAMIFYDGGSKFNPGATSYDFFSNYFSDLGSMTDYRGQQNTMPMIFFSIAFFCLSACYALLFIVLPSAFSNNPIGRRWMIVASVLGIISCVFIFTIPLAPGSVYPALHYQLALIFYLSIAIAAFISAGATWKVKAYPRGCAWAGIAVFILVLLFGISSLVLGTNTPEMLSLNVILQKLVHYTVSTWSTLVALATWRVLKSAGKAIE